MRQLNFWWRLYFKPWQSLRHLPRYIVEDRSLFDKNQATLLSPHLLSLMVVNCLQETWILAECAVLWIKYMKMSSQTAIRKCSIEQLVWKFLHMKTSVEELFTRSKDPYKRFPPSAFFYCASFFCICIGWHIFRWKKVRIGSYFMFLKALFK